MLCIQFDPLATKLHLNQYLKNIENDVLKRYYLKKK